MEILKISEIVKATNGELISGSFSSEIKEITTDSRVIGKESFFIPLKGEKFDGHDFIPEALRAGAKGCLTHKDIDVNIQEFKDKVIIKVDDTLTAFHDIARYYRKMFGIPFIAITGSVGKTTTKNMIAEVLAKKYNVLKTYENYNNHVGLPLTVLSLNKEHDIGVVEMGMSGFGEIKRLVSIVEPEITVITNIGMAHIEKLGSRQNILKAKMEIFDKMQMDGLAVLNADDSLLWELRELLPFKKAYFGIYNEESDFKASDISYCGISGHSTFNIKINHNIYKVKIPILGEHGIYNALVSIILGLHYGVEPEEIIKALAEYKTGSMRSDIIKTPSGITLIEDCYNASPASMYSAIRVLNKVESQGRKIAILGDMLELGEWSEQTHREVGEFVASNNIEYLITVGKNSKNISLAAKENGMSSSDVFSFDTNEEVVEFISEFLCCGDTVLVKGSRGMNMEKISEYIKKAESWKVGKSER